jgi:hypothetical protein
MIDAYDVYLMYLGLKLHFSKPNYNYFKYGGKTRASKDAFLKRRDRYFFGKIGRNYTKEEINYLFIANLVHDSNMWIGAFFDTEAQERYMDFRKKMESIQYTFKENAEVVVKHIKKHNLKFDDLFKRKGNNVEIVNLLNWKHIDLIFFVILDKMLGFCPHLDGDLQNDLWWEKTSLKVAKLSDFIKIEDLGVYKSLMLKALEDS